MSDDQPTEWYGPDCTRCGKQCTQCWFPIGEGEWACFSCATDSEMLGALDLGLVRDV
jgi:hypothetical protein